MLDMLFIDIILFCSGSHFVQRSRTICAIIIDHIIRTNPVKFVVQEEMSKIFLFYALSPCCFNKIKTKTDHNNSP